MHKGSQREDQREKTQMRVGETVTDREKREKRDTMRTEVRDEERVGDREEQITKGRTESGRGI